MIPAETLSKLLSHLPKKPGVYLMYDRQDTVIYVGKSRFLKNRVSSYFRTKQRDSKTDRLVHAVERLEFIVTTTEIEALVLENNLIKRHKPRYNIMLKDSKTHPYLLLTTAEAFPRLLKVRKVRFGDGNRYFGPFPDESGLRHIIELISRTWKICSCKNPIQIEKPAQRACLKYSIGLCFGPCIGAIHPEAYAPAVESAIGFLTGRHPPDLGAMQKTMETFAAEFRFEEAAELRDTIGALKNYFERQKVDLVTPVDLDLWGVAETRDQIVVSVFFLRGGKLLGHRTIEAEREPGTSLEEGLGSLFQRFYDNNLIPPTILTNHRPMPLDPLVELFSDRSGHRVRIARPLRGARRKLLSMADENAAEILRNLKSPDITRIAEGVLDLERRLQLPRSPIRVECIDISHLHGEDVVASLVVSINGEARKSEYRRYYIKDVPGIDDPASIREVTRRRFKRLLDEGAPLPDLFIVDGGIAQVNGARAELDALAVDRPVWGLAKREELLVPPHGEPVKLPLTCPAMRLVIRLRDEAHRFANAFRSKVQAKRVIRSALLSLPGVGPKTLQKVLASFGSLDRASKATAEEIASRAGIPLKIASIIQRSITSQQEPGEKP